MKISHALLQSFFEDPLPNPKDIEKSLIFKAFEVESVTAVGDDYLYDIKILPDRAHDCLSHIGIAREVSAQWNIPCITPQTQNITTSPTALTVRVDAPFVRRYIGVVIRDVTVGASPQWLQEALARLGLKSINNVVDITNYLLHYYGTPLHVFDYDRMHPHIVVRAATPGEMITVLGGTTYTLDDTDMLITDGVYPLALAGVKGGIHAEVSEHTKTLLLEVANFDPVTVRKTSRRLSLLTDAAKRFENDFSSEALDASLSHALELYCELAGGVPETPVDQYVIPEEKVKISLPYNAISALLGITIPEDSVQNIFERIGCICEKTTDGLNITPPYWRKDMHTVPDCIDEIARLYGYEHIPDMSYPLPHTVRVPASIAQSARLRLKLQEAGFSELYTYTFSKKGIRSVLSPLAKDKAYLRNSLKEQFTIALEQNHSRRELLGVSAIQAFEIGTIFLEDSESLHVIASATNESRRIFEEEQLTIISEDARTIEAIITNDTTTVPFDAAVFPKAPTGVIHPWSVYPYIVRDISLWVPETLSAPSLIELLQKAVSNSPVPIRCIDEYHKEGRVSYTFRIIFQSFERTLTDVEVETYMTSIYEALRLYPEIEIR